MNLFQSGNFVLSSGKTSSWKIECDSLTTEDWETLGRLIAEDAIEFGSVLGVPRGGKPLEDALRPYCSSYGPRLVVDDVLTTGENIKKYMKDDDIGYVVFSRGPLPENIKSLFKMEF